MAGLALHIRDVVVQHDAEAFDHHTAAEEVADSLTGGHNRSFAIHHDKVSRAAAGRRRVRAP